MIIDYILLYFTSNSGLEEESCSVISHHLPLSAPPSLSALKAFTNQKLYIEIVDGFMTQAAVGLKRPIFPLHPISQNSWHPMICRV